MNNSRRQTSAIFRYAVPPLLRGTSHRPSPQALVLSPPSCRSPFPEPSQARGFGRRTEFLVFSFPSPKPSCPTAAAHPPTRPTHQPLSPMPSKGPVPSSGHAGSRANTQLNHLPSSSSVVPTQGFPSWVKELGLVAREEASRQRKPASAVQRVCRYHGSVAQLPSVRLLRRRFLPRHLHTCLG